MSKEGKILSDKKAEEIVNSIDYDVLIIAEGLTMYLSEEEIKAIFFSVSKQISTC